MAVLKHIASKNHNYTDALNYLLFQHDEISGKAILDDQGRMILREEYFIDGINCEPLLFDEECARINKKYHKNQTFREIKSHHYIISFDPKDRDDHGLTGERAQELGLEFAKKNFPGHQALVVTHTDGHNSSGNIHVHIVINSLRMLDVELQDFMERACDSKAGYKHHQTKELLRHLKHSLMEMCEREHLYQVDLLSPARDKITDKEYWAARHGRMTSSGRQLLRRPERSEDQEKLGTTNAQITGDGLKPRNTKFQTQKQYLRDAILDVAGTAKSLEEFKRLLRDRYQILLTDRRGRFSFLHPDRNKNISERALGSGYTRAVILEMIEANTFAHAEQAKGIIAAGNITAKAEGTAEIPTTGEDYSSAAQDQSAAASGSGENIIPDSADVFADLPPIFFIHSDLRLVVDLQTCVKAQQSRAYERKVKISNLKEMAKTVAYVQENHFDTREELQARYREVKEKLSDARRTLKETESRIRNVNRQIHYTGQYLANKSVYSQFLKSRSKKKFRQEHRSELELYETAVKFLKEKNPDGKIPSMKALKAEKGNLEIQRSAQQKTYKYFQDYQKELRTVCANVDAILGWERNPERSQSLVMQVASAAGRTAG